MAKPRTLQDVIGIFQKAPRIGADKDEPEGMRYIQISDTLAAQILECLERAEISLEKFAPHKDWR